MKLLSLTLAILVSFSALAQLRIDPKEDPVAEKLFLALDFVQHEIEWVRGHQIDGVGMDPEFLLVNRERPLLNGLDPQHYFYSTHYLMFISLDWKWLCQVSVDVLWHREFEQRLEIISEHTDLRAKTFCFPRISKQAQKIFQTE